VENPGDSSFKAKVSRDAGKPLDKSTFAAKFRAHAIAQY
jgi:hypothetical protein